MGIDTERWALLTSSDNTLSIVVERMPPKRVVVCSIPRRCITFFFRRFFLSSRYLFVINPLFGRDTQWWTVSTITMPVSTITTTPYQIYHRTTRTRFHKSRIRNFPYEIPDYYVPVSTITMPLSTITTTSYQIYHRLNRNRFHESARAYQSTCVLMDISRKLDFDNRRNRGLYSAVPRPILKQEE